MIHIKPGLLLIIGIIFSRYSSRDICVNKGKTSYTQHDIDEFTSQTQTSLFQTIFQT